MWWVGVGWVGVGWVTEKFRGNECGVEYGVCK